MTPPPPERQCTANSKQTGQRCGRYALPGLTVCRYHGGATAAARAKSGRAIEAAAAQAAAERATRQIGIQIVTTPEQALLDEIQRASGMVAYYGARVAEIADADPGKLIRGTTRVKRREGFQPATTQTVETTPSIWLVLWGQERDRLVRASAVAIRAGIAERRVELAEQQGLMIYAMIRRILDRLDLTASQNVLAGEVVPAELRALAGGAT